MSEPQQTLTIQQAIDLAVQHHTSGRLSQAENIYQQILRNDPNQPIPLHLLGVIAHQEGRNDVALDLITKALNLKPDFPEAHSNLGLVLHELGKPEKAVTSYRKAIDLKPDYAEAHNNLGNSFRNLGKVKEAEASYRAALSHKPSYAEAHSNLATTLQDLGKLKESVDGYRTALTITPDLFEAHYNLGHVLQKLDRQEDAAASYRKALELKSDYAEVHQNFGIALEKLGRLEEAVGSYQKALRLKPNYTLAHQNLGVALSKLGKLKKAVVSYRKALSFKPDFAEAHNNLGNAFLRLGEPDDAVASCRKALAIKPDLVEAHNNLGNALRDFGKVEDAVASFQKALVLKPDYAEAHCNLGTALRDLHRLEEAEDSYQRALSIQPDLTEALGNYGILLLALGRRQEAISYFHKQLELVRGENPANLYLESFRFVTKAKMRHDIEQFRYLESLGTDADRFGELARTYSELDREIQWPDNESTAVPLSDEHRNRIGDSYNRPIHLLETPEIPGSALNQNLDVKSITQSYMGNAPGMTYFDNLLSPEALQALRRFLMESTIWYDFKYSGGYLGAMLVDGMACPLLFQIADELRQTFPDIFKHHPLYQLWAYKYDSQLTGINVHADFAAINVNFWVTPDSANRNPDNGGLIVHKEKAPLDWRFTSYNPVNAEGYQRIREFLTEHDSEKMVVPYAENRVVLFNSDLFHETDQLEFKPGYENRRINITMLFGNRWD